MESRLSAIERLADKLGASSDHELSKLGELILKGMGSQLRARRRHQPADSRGPGGGPLLGQGGGWIHLVTGERGEQPPVRQQHEVGHMGRTQAVMHRYRGNKSGSMDEAISRSLLVLNKMNPIAFEVQDGLPLNRHPAVSPRGSWIGSGSSWRRLSRFWTYSMTTPASANRTGPRFREAQEMPKDSLAGIRRGAIYGRGSWRPSMAWKPRGWWVGLVIVDLSGMVRSQLLNLSIAALRRHRGRFRGRFRWTWSPMR